MSTFSTNNIYNHCDAAISAVQEQLSAVKSILAKHETEQQSLLTEKSSLEDIVSNLRLEKDQLEKQVEDLRATLHDLTKDVVDTTKGRNQQMLTHIYTTGAAAASYDSSSDISGDDDSSEVICISHDDGFGDSLAERDDSVFKQLQDAFIDCANDSLTEQTGTNQTEDDYPMLTQPPIEDVLLHGVVGVSESQRQANITSREAPFSMSDTVSFISAASSTSSSNKRRRRVSKVYNSPKKWRRMMRTRRLQSILLVN